MTGEGGSRKGGFCDVQHNNPITVWGMITAESRFCETESLLNICFKSSFSQQISWAQTLNSCIFGGVNKQQEVIVFDLKRHVLAVQAADRDANESELNR